MLILIWFIVSIVMSFKLASKSDKKSAYSTLEYFCFWFLMHICTYWIPFFILMSLGVDL